jgi:hypothetical protein
MKKTLALIVVIVMLALQVVIPIPMSSTVLAEGVTTSPQVSTQTSTPTTTIVTWNDSNDVIKYGGTWLDRPYPGCFKGDDHFSDKKGDWFGFNFEGTRAKIYGIKGNWCGQFNVYFFEKDTGVMIDTYASETSYNQLWYDTGEIPYGKYEVFFSISGKNPESTGYALEFDRAEITSGIPEPTPTPVSDTIIWNDSNDDIIFNGTWYDRGYFDCLEDDTHTSWEKGASLQFPFTGTQVKIYGVKGSWCGKADIYIDDVFKTTIDTFDKVEKYQRLWYDSSKLPYGNHTFKLVVVRPSIEFDKVVIINGDPEPTPDIYVLNSRNQYIKYDGAWTRYGGLSGYYKEDVQSTDIIGDSFQYTFTGIQAKLYGTKGYWCGKADIYIDNVFKSTIDTYSASVLLQELWFDTGKLPLGDHTIKLIVSGKNPKSQSNTIEFDKIEFIENELTPTLTPTPTATPTPTPTPTPKDVIAPAAPRVNTVDDNDITLIGRTEALAVVQIKKGRTVIGSSKAGSNGSFKITIPVQKAGTALLVTAKDAAGNESKPTKVKVKDGTPPSIPTVNTIKSTAKVVTGKAEAGSLVVIKKGSTTLVSGNATSGGTFSLKITAQKTGTVLHITAKDKAGNTSGARKVVVVK